MADDGKSDSEDDIVRDSIIKNKERTKSYWEQMMMAASENQNVSKTRPWDSNESSESTSASNRNSVSSIDYTEDTMTNQKEDDREEVDFADADLELTIVKDEKRRIERELRLQRDRQRSDMDNSLTVEDRINMELKEMQAREEELKQLRKSISHDSNTKEMFPEKETITANGNEELSSIHTTDDSNYSEYGSEEKESSLDGNRSSRGTTPFLGDFLNGRTQSMDSVSSGHSSGSGSLSNERERISRRKIIVKPYEDSEEETPTSVYKRNEKETPIEREIRLAKEREEELRREKGVALSNNEENNSFKVNNKLKNKKNALENDPRGVQHRLATNRIQQEIEEASEREHELRTEGKILTTSEETVDAKVTRFTQLAEFAISENRRSKDPKMKRSSSVSQLLIALDNEDRSSSVHTKPQQQQQPVNTYVPQVTSKYSKNPASRGLMQRFIANKGRMSMPSISTTSSTFSNISTSVSLTPKRKPSLDSSIMPTRKGYISAEEKIQEELKEMKKREEELRLQRAHSFARSQPNLLDIAQDEEELHSWTSHKEATKTTSNLSHSLSNPNLLDDSGEKINPSKTSRKRLFLIEEWENRINSVQQEA